MTAIDAPHSRVLYLDGEGITLADMNNAQTRLQAHMLDFFNSSYSQLGNDPERAWVTPTDTICYAPRAGAGFPYAGAPGSTREVSVERGWICQKNPSGPFFPNGADAVVLAAVLPHSAGLFTLDVGDVSNPRIDLIQVRLTEIDDDAVDRDFEGAVTRAKSTFVVNTSKRVQIDIEVKPGTPAANPVPPSPDSGYAEFARVRVDTAATSIDIDDVFDMRMPMRVEAQRIHPYMIGRPGTPHWTHAIGTSVGIIRGAGTDACYAFPHTTDLCGRIVGVWVNGVLVASGAQQCQIVRYDDNDGVLATQLIADIYSAMGFAGGTVRWHQLTGLATGTSATNDNDQRPIWTNFYGPHASKAAAPLAHGSFYKVGMKINGDQLSQIWEAGFYVATDI